MRRLCVLRHAKSDWKDPSLDDLNRPLNDRGWAAARRIGHEMKHRRMRFDLILASTAARVRETIDGIEEKFEFHAEVRFEPQLYLADTDALLSRVAALPDEANAPLIVGHNPGLQQLLLALTRDDGQGLRTRIAGKYPTGAFAAVELDIERWKEARPGCGRIVELILPKDLN